MKTLSIAFAACFGTLFSFSTSSLRADDWPIAGRDRTRNAVSPEKGGPTDWDVRTGRNIKWKAHLGSFSACEPIVSGGLVWTGTDNSEPRDKAVQEPAGILACFRERDGAFVYLLWKHRVNEQVWGAPLVVDGKIYVANTDGGVDILALSKTRSVIAHREFEEQILSSPIFANGVLYIVAGANLFAIQQPPSSQGQLNPNQLP